MLHIPPPCPHWLSILFGPSTLLSNGFYFSCLSYLSFSLLESLLLAFKSSSYFPFGHLPGHHPSSSSKQTAVLTAFPTPGLSCQAYPSWLSCSSYMSLTSNLFRKAQFFFLFYLGFLSPLNNLPHSFPFSPLSQRSHSHVYEDGFPVCVFYSLASVVFPESQSPY